MNFNLETMTFKMKLSNYYSYLNDKGSVRKIDKNFGQKHTSVYTEHAAHLRGNTVRPILSCRGIAKNIP